MWKVNNEGQLRWLGPEKGVIGEENLQLSFDCHEKGIIGEKNLWLSFDYPGKGMIGEENL